MKKIIILAAAVLSFASCSKDNEDIITDAKVPGTIQAETSMADNTTRVVWKNPEGTGSSATISVLFNSQDNFDLYEIVNNETVGPSLFSKVGEGTDQSATFNGLWSGTNKSEWAAILPHKDGNSIIMKKEENGKLTNKYTFVIPSSQTASVTPWTTAGTDPVTTYSISPDRNANIMLASKNSENTTSGFFAPVCSYLYFATQVRDENEHTTVILESLNNKDLAGTVEMTTTGQWDSWDNFKAIGIAAHKNEKVKITTGVKTITVTSGEVTRSNNRSFNEYIVCVLPGTHAFKIETNTGTTLGYTDEIVMNAANVYYLGLID